MDTMLIGGVGLVALIALLAIRVPVGIALSIVSMIGLWMLRGLNGAIGAIKGIPYDFTAH